ncbi:MAG TPA: hypothetical protein DIW64_18210 [Cellvibrio sp.]|nr:hypothetical protein [Cellvibrio sp.]
MLTYEPLKTQPELIMEKKELQPRWQLPADFSVDSACGRQSSREHSGFKPNATRTKKIAQGAKP